MLSNNVYKIVISDDVIKSVCKVFINEIVNDIIVINDEDNEIIYFKVMNKGFDDNYIKERNDDIIIDLIFDEIVI